MTGALETVNDDDITVTYIRHMWIAREGATREKELYKNIKGKLKSNQAAVDFAHALGKTSRKYVALLNASDHEVWSSFPPSTRQCVSKVRLLGWKQIRPLMLAVLNSMSTKEVDKAFRAFLCWTVRLVIAGGLGSGSVEDSFSECAKRVTIGEIKTARKIYEFLSNFIHNDEVFRAAFTIARVSKPAIARYYLRALEQQQQNESEPELVANDDPAAITLEHVLPQDPQGGWKHIDPEVYPSLVHRLGNQALLRKKVNSDRKSDEFKDKVEDYGNSSFALTSMLASRPKWDADEVSERQKFLADLAVKAWPLAVR